MNKTDQEKDLNGNKLDEIAFKKFNLKIQKWGHYFSSKWVIILIAGVIGGTIGFTYAFLKKPIYTAELSFALQDEKSEGGLSGALGLASQFGIDLGGGGGGAFSGDNLLELMKSRLMVEKTLLTAVDIKGKKQTLAELYITFNNFRDKWSDKPELKNVHFLPDEDKSKFSIQKDSLLGEFHKALIRDNLTVEKVDKKLSIINVDIKSKNELFSKYFTEILVDAVARFYVETKTKKSSLNVNILQHQTDSVKRELNGAISGVAASIDATPNPNALRQLLRAPSQRRQVDVQANTAILTELVKNLEISKVTLRKETPLVQIIDRPILPLEKTQSSKLLATIIGTLMGMLTTVFIIVFFKPIMNIIIKSF